MPARGASGQRDGTFGAQSGHRPSARRPARKIGTSVRLTSRQSSSASAGYVRHAEAAHVRSALDMGASLATG